MAAAATFQSFGGLRRQPLALTLWNVAVIAVGILSVGSWIPKHPCLVTSLSVVRKYPKARDSSSLSSSLSLPLSSLSSLSSALHLFHHRHRENERCNPIANDDHHTRGSHHHPHHHHHHHHNRQRRQPLERRRILSDLLLGSLKTAPILLLPETAFASIDVSGLTVRENPLDVFLGGTYYETKNDESGGDETVDGRISRRKYSIVEEAPGRGGLLAAPKKKSKRDTFFRDLDDRPVRILGESTSISSSRDDPFELRGNLFLCRESPSKSVGGCIAVDFSPLGGPSEVRGYWDDSERGIRFGDGLNNTVWSKQ